MSLPLPVPPPHNESASTPASSSRTHPKRPLQLPFFTFLRGPGQKNVDLSLFKNFPVTDTSAVQFRAEIFNIGNWENFNNPYNNLAVMSTVATTPALSASGPRVIQFALKYKF